MHKVLFLWALSLPLVSQAGDQKTCLYINSYHKGYEWSDKIESALYKGVGDACKMTTFYLDAKRAPKEAKAHGLEAKALIEKTKPSLVVVSDDNAVAEVLKPYFKDSTVPFVFCGVNWSTKAHGLPYANATGMIEISPVKQLAQELKKVNKKIKSGIYLAGDVAADQENYQIFADFYKEEGVELKPALVKTFDDWKTAFKKASKEGFILVANNAGIEGWKDEEVAKTIAQSSKTLTATNHDYMVKYVAMGLTKIAEEQGEWAAKVAVDMLHGTSAKDIPVVVNRQWNYYLNEKLIKKLGFNVSKEMKQRAIAVGN